MASINNNYANIGQVKVEKWNGKKQDETQALNNDCYWNIAANTLDAGATNEEIAQVMNEMIELNAFEDANGNYNTNLEVDDVVLMPIEQTISQADNEIQQVLQNNETSENQKAELLNLKSALEELSKEYDSKDSVNDEQKAQYQKMLDSIDEEIMLKDSQIKDENIALQELSEEESVEKPNVQEAQKDNSENIENIQNNSAEVEHDLKQNNETQNAAENKKRIDSYYNTYNAKEATIKVLNDENMTSADIISAVQAYNDNYDSFVNDIDATTDKKTRSELMNKFSAAINDEINNGNKDALNLLSEEIHNSTAGKLGTSDEFIASVMENSSDENLAKMMESYNSATGSEIYKDIKNDFSGKTQENYLNKLDNAYKNTNNEEYTGWNDGKLSIEESISTFANKIKENTVNFVKKNGVILAAGTAIGVAAGGAVASVAAVPAGAAALVGIGVVAAGTGIVKGIKTIGNFFKHQEELANAKTDDEAKQCVENFADDAGNALDSGLSVFGGVQVAKMGVNSLKAIKEAQSAAQGLQDAAKGVHGAVRGAKNAAQGAKTANEAIQGEKSLSGLIKGVSGKIIGGSGLSKVAMDSAGTVAQAAGGVLGGPNKKPHDNQNPQLAQNEQENTQIVQNDSENQKPRPERKRPPKK